VVLKLYIFLNPMECKNAGVFLDVWMLYRKNTNFVVRCSLPRGSKEREREIIRLETFKGI
jgi:hypothetical protein